MDLLSIAILLQLRCLLFYCRVNRAQARAAFMGLVLGGEERHKTMLKRFVCDKSLYKASLYKSKSRHKIAGRHSGY